MIKNYFTTALRSILKSKVYTLVNVIGLVAGLTAAILIFLYIDYERSYDQFLENKDRLYRVELTRTKQGEVISQLAAGCAGIGPALKENFPEVKKFTKLTTTGALFRYDDVVLDVEKVMLVTEDFFTMFSYPLIEGVDSLVLSRVNTVVLSETVAKSLFKETDPLGKLVNFRGVLDLEVTGVYKDFPQNTHMDLNAMISLDTYANRAGPEYLTTWKLDGFYTYILLAEGADPQALQAKLPEFVLQQQGEWLAEINQAMEFRLMPVTDIHLLSHQSDEMRVNGDVKVVEYLLLILIFILAIAWINYVNMATAKSLERAKEVGIRKVLGGYRAQLMAQFLVETCMLNIVALAISIVVVLLILPSFSTLTGIPFNFSFLSNKNFWWLAVLILVGGSFISGLYPAFFLSGYNPMMVLKGKFKGSIQGLLLRRGLVIVQFAVAVVMLVATYGVYKQIQFMRNQSLGFSIDQIVMVRKPLVKDLDFGNKLEAFRGETTRIKDVYGVSSISELPGTPVRWSANGVRRLSAEKGEAIEIPVFSIDTGYIRVFDLELLEGRNYKGIEERGKSVIINQKAARLLGFQNDAAALQEPIVFWEDTVSVIGVLKDYHHETLKLEGSAIIYPISNVQTEINYFAVKVGTANMSATLEEIEKVYQNFFSGNPFNYFFLDEHYNEQYKQDILFGKVAGIFSVLAIVLTCMGLFGLSSYTASLRIQEIGIRKVMGASVSSLIFMMSKEYLLLTALGIVIGIPIVWFGLHEWLQTFAIRLETNWFLFFVPCAAIVVLTFLVISYQTIKAALSNPVDTLRNE